MLATGVYQRGGLGWSGGVYECQRAVSAACDDKRWTCTSAGVGP